MKLPDFITVYVGGRKYTGGQECPEKLIDKKLIDQVIEKAKIDGANVKKKGVIESMTKSPALRQIMHAARQKAGNFFDDEEIPAKEKKKKSDK